MSYQILIHALDMALVRTFFTKATYGQRKADPTCANFDDTIFGRGANFASTNFSSGINSTNAEMKGRTSFSDAKFSAPPQCFNAKLHEGTTWDGVQ